MEKIAISTLSMRWKTIIALLRYSTFWGTDAKFAWMVSLGVVAWTMHETSLTVTVSAMPMSSHFERTTSLTFSSMNLLSSFLGRDSAVKSVCTPPPRSGLWPGLAPSLPPDPGTGGTSWLLVGSLIGASRPLISVQALCSGSDPGGIEGPSRSPSVIFLPASVLVAGRTRLPGSCVTNSAAPGSGAEAGGGCGRPASGPSPPPPPPPFSMLMPFLSSP
mmetsp:Transcript_9625/g.19195  ORF Transcript_9625/g.19195 Transcript_9625/m.19195 type:complete len:218 (-) Transcript_9625:410-1063(-)